MMIYVSELNFIQQAPDKTTANVLVVPVITGDNGVHILADSLPKKVAAGLDEVLPKIGVSGKTGALTRIPAPSGIAADTVAFVGTGKNQDKLESIDLREAFGAAVRGLSGVSHVALAVPFDDPESIYQSGLGALLGAYTFEDYKVQTAPPETITITAPSKLKKAELGALATEASIVAEAVNKVRDHVNIPAADLTPVTMAEVAEAYAKTDRNLSVRVWDEKQLEQDGFGGILGVGQGSVNPPRLVRFEYKAKGATATLALVGKGITFDSGGLSIKPAKSMETMKTDMTGAATVLETVYAASRLGLKVNLVGWLCMAENLPSSTATRPGDVLTMYSGRTVEVNNTDAEGRLVLGDGLARAVEEKPDAVIDIATLTGAQIVALGSRITGVMGTDDVRNEIIESAELTGEDMWPMPLPAHLKKGLDSDIADTKNSGGRGGGMLTAGLFLAEYVGETPWAHLDIAGPSFNEDGPFGSTPKGGTGVAVQTLLSWATAHTADAK